MAAITSTATGYWDSGGTWVGGVAPGSADVATVANGHTVTIRTAITTGGTSVTGTTGLRVNAGGTLAFVTGGSIVLTNDLYPVNSYSVPYSQITMAAGTSFTFKPGSGQNCRVYVAGGGILGAIAINGSSGSRCTFATDLSAGGNNTTWANPNDAYVGGIFTATYCDFTNFGTTSAGGIMSQPGTYASTSFPTTIDNCTFTNAFFGLSCQNSSNVNVSITNNKFISSPQNTGLHIGAKAVFVGTSATQTFSYNACSWTNCIAYLTPGAVATITDNVFYCASDTLAPTLNSPWTSDTQVARNLIVSTFTGNMGIPGSARDCYLVATGSNNPHFTGIGVVSESHSATGFIFEYSDNTGGGGGDIIFPSGTLAVTNCIVLPNAYSGASSGKLVSNLQGSGAFVTCNHNTFCANGTTLNDTNCSIIGMGESGGGEYAGVAPSVQSNLIWASTLSSGGYGFACNDGVYGSPNGDGTGGWTDAVTVAGHNGFWNPQSTGKCWYNGTASARSGGTAQTGVTGYNGIRVSTNATFPNSQIGTGDVSGNPGFVDSTRALATWGGTTAGGGTATIAGAVSALLANPALIGQASTGLLAWIRAGFVPTNASFHSTYSGDASSVDAAGTSWSSGQSMGALAWQTLAAPLPSPPFPNIPAALLAM